MSRPVSEDSRELRRILVLGGDREGMAVAERLAKDSFEVVLLGTTGSADLPKRVTSVPEGVLEAVRGFVGAFAVTLRTPEGRRQEQVDAIVAASPPERIPKFEIYGLTPSKRTVSLSHAEELPDSAISVHKSGDKWFHAVFLVGLEGGSDTAVFSRAFSCAERLQTLDRVQTYLFTRHVKVADDDLESLYRDLRQQGVLFFRFDAEGPSFESTEEGLRMVFRDPLLGTEMELSPDLLVVDEDLAPSQQLRPLIDAIPSAGGFRPYVQPDSVRFPGVETPKAGILAIGASRGRFFPALFTAELDALSLHLKMLAANGRPKDIPGPAEVDPSKCTLCLTCVRLCTHGAIGFRTAAEVDGLSCVGCGICAAECPMRAIVVVPRAEQPEIEGQIRRGLSQAHSDHRVVAFLCKKSGTGAMAAAGNGALKNLVTVEIPCAGTLDPAHVMYALQAGADRVLIAACHKGNCASIYGTDLARARIAGVTSFLADARLDPGRVKFVTLASNTPGELVRAVRDLRSASEPARSAT
ncbi:MAG: hydrogenase iron-sulfur subunit [Thermodesulfobacteriota bacterium]